MREIALGEVNTIGTYLAFRRSRSGRWLDFLTPFSVVSRTGSYGLICQRHQSSDRTDGLALANGERRTQRSFEQVSTAPGNSIRRNASGLRTRWDFKNCSAASIWRLPCTFARTLTTVSEYFPVSMLAVSSQSENVGLRVFLLA
jgi:hypothetical protein